MDYLKLRQRFKIFKSKKISETKDIRQFSRNVSEFTEDLEKFLKDYVKWSENIYEEIAKRANHSLGINVSATWNPGNIAAGSYEAKEVTVQDANLEDFAIASFSLDISDLMLSADVTAANTVTCVLFNPTGGAINLSEGTLRVRVYER